VIAIVIVIFALVANGWDNDLMVADDPKEGYVTRRPERND
jgi:hypothetical protein